MDSFVVSGYAEDAEAQRLAILRNHGVLDGPDDEELQRLVRLACRVGRVPIAYLALLDQARIHILAAQGVARTDLPREKSLCQHVYLSGESYVVLPDLQVLEPHIRASFEPEFVANQNATFGAAPFKASSLRFFAGAVVRSSQGTVLGVLCVGDDQPHYDFMADDGARLEQLAQLVAERLQVSGLCHLAARDPRALLACADEASLGLLQVDALGHIQYANPAAALLLERSASTLPGRAICELLAELGVARHWLDIEALAAVDDEPPCHVLPLRREDGGTRQLELRVVRLRSKDAGTYTLILQNAGAYRQREHALFAYAKHDPVTELPMPERLTTLWREYLYEERLITLLLVEFEDLQSVNEQAGYRVGNAVFRVMAQRLQDFFEAADVVRLLGARIAVVWPQHLVLEEIVAHCRQGLTALRAPVTFEEQVFQVQARFGVVQVDGRTLPNDLETSLTHADLALFEARKHRSGYRLFTPGLQEAVLWRKHLDRELRRAAELEQFSLVFQPQLELKSRRVIGAEALLRWNHPQKGQLRPAAFIETLEASVVASRVGAWVLSQACHHAAQWRRAGLLDFRISVNLFSGQVHGDSLLASVEAALASSGLEPEALELELTENIVLELEPRLLRTLHELRERGVGLALDDYGTGYASLSLLKRLPLTRLKVDRSFVSHLPEDPGDAAVVEAILLMARQFRLGVVAEGVETPAQEQFLRQLECPEVQGYMYGVPMSAREFWRNFGLQGSA